MSTDPGWPPIDPAAVRPTITDVAILERTRTIDAGGGDVGTFTDTTRPTDTEVGELIDQAQDEVLIQLPAAIDPAAYASVTRLIALRTAGLVEISFYRDQSESGGGVASTLAGMYLSDLAALLDLLHVGALRLA